MSAPLDTSEFAAFFRAVHGHEPFPWQERLAHLVFTKGWPTALDVPTGAGKTAAIDIAVFHLALEAKRGAARRAPVRILFVVDRRLVVEDAHGRAKRIADSLAEAAGSSTLLGRVASRLGYLAETTKRPLEVARLRGGIPREPDWVRTPAQPTVVVSTVDQVGSRLLFRGYGVSDTMKPLHAGLVGSDALVLLDEAHLSHPFLETARALRAHQDEARWSDNRAPAPYRLVTLSATQLDTAPPLVLDDDRAHPKLGPRLAASKPADLTLVKSAADAPETVQAFADAAWDLSVLGGGAGRVVGVVVNRVRRARRIHAALTSRMPKGGIETGDAEDRSVADVVLLVGRCRPLDRDRMLSKVLPRMKAERTESGSDRPLFVVATQCIEAGADLDFDALVTELAPLDCLRQRFGRLNRMGRPIEARAAVLGLAEQVASRAKPDPIYGKALGTTWKLLTDKAQRSGKKGKERLQLGFGVEEARAWVPSVSELGDLVAPRSEAPVLLPAYVEQWCVTSPLPDADPDPGLFLHGPASGPADVQIVWRADVAAEDDLEEWKARVAVCPPSTLEALSVPFYEAKRWLERRATGDVPDVEAAGTDDEDDLVTRRGRRTALVWHGPEESKFLRGRLRPGSLLVVASSEGGCDEWGWQPDSESAVGDLAEEANRAHRGKDILRLAPRLFVLAAVAAGAREPDAVAASERFAKALEPIKELKARELTSELSSLPGLPTEWKSWMADGAWEVVRDGSGRPLGLQRRAKRSQITETTGEAATEGDAGSQGPYPIPLAVHSQGVRDMAADFVERLGLPATVAADVVLAAYLHDAGKAHPEFKRWLYAGDELAAEAGPPLAKSGRERLGRRARLASGLPDGARHEVASLAFALAHPRFGEADDPALVLWLIGTHHGYGRPFFPGVAWPGSGGFDADLGDGDVHALSNLDLAFWTSRWPDLQAELSNRYGPWGLARLEAILRLADHRRSQIEKEPDISDGLKTAAPPRSDFTVEALS